MKLIYLIRHARPQFPPGPSLCIGSTDLPLSPEGREQAAQLAQIMPPVTNLWCSPMLRATQTADALGQPYEILPGLREVHMGQWEGRSFPEIRAQYPELYAARGNDLSLLPPGAEIGAAQRFRQALVYAWEHSEGSCAVITHSGIISLLLYELTGRWYKPRYGEVLPLDPEKILPRS